MRVGAVGAALFCLVASLLPSSPVCADVGIEIIVDRNIHLAPSLSAVIIDSEGSPIKGVVVEETGENWTGLLRTTTSDASGRFTFEPVKGRKIYYFIFKSDGFHWMEYRMKVNPLHWKTLKLLMEVAT